MGSGFEKRVMRITAYTAHDANMRGDGITASGVKAVGGVTVAADKAIPLGTQIVIPELNMTLTVQDRGGAIHGNRLDVFMDKRSDALEFGIKTLEAWVIKS